jgi:PAS domain S-box-containing protein
MSFATPHNPHIDERADPDFQPPWQLFEQTPTFICIKKGADHVYEFANEAYRRLVGQRALIGKSVRDAAPENYGQSFYEQLDSVYKTCGRIFANAVVVRMALTEDGPLEERFFNLVYEPMMDDNGRVTSVFMQGHDVTDVLLAQERVRSSDDRFHVFAQCIPAHVWTSRPDGYVDWFNDQTYAYTGYEPGTFFWR